MAKEKNTPKTLTLEERLDRFMFSIEEERKRHQDAMKELQEIRNIQKKSTEESDKEMKKLRQLVGGISESNGAMAEEMIYNSLKKDKTFAGITFDEIDRNLKMKLKKFNLEGEFDVVLQNCNTLAIIETKYKVRVEDVSKLVDKKVNDFRKLFPVFNDYKIVLGIGGMSFEGQAEDVANENGVGIIKIVGDKVEYYTDKIKVY